VTKAHGRGLRRRERDEYNNTKTESTRYHGEEEPDENVRGGSNINNNCNKEEDGVHDGTLKAVLEPRG